MKQKASERKSKMEADTEKLGAAGGGGGSILCEII